MPLIATLLGELYGEAVMRETSVGKNVKTDVVDTQTNTSVDDMRTEITNLMKEELKSQIGTGDTYDSALKNKTITNILDNIETDSIWTKLNTIKSIQTSNPATYSRLMNSEDDTNIIYTAYTNALKKYQEEHPEKTQEEVTKEAQQALTNLITGDTNTRYYIPQAGIQQSYEQVTNAPTQSNPLLQLYSPRLLGAPPQLTNLCDMRLLSAYDDQHYGPVGDYYLTKILQDAPICNFFVGRARFTGGVGSFWGIINQTKNYLKALNTYNIYGDGSDAVPNLNQATVMERVVEQEAAFDAFNTEIGEDEDLDFNIVKASDLGLEDVEGDTEVADINGDTKGMLESIADSFFGGAAGITASLLTSLSVQQPFYTFEPDWYTYINNVKMMINSAVIMLGLQSASVRIGKELVSIKTGNTTKDGETDVWADYRFITPTSGTGVVTERENITGNTSQYISVMVDPNSFTETYTNNIGDSQLFGIMNQGQGFGNEIAFLTNASTTKADDIIINLAQKGTNAAAAVMSSLGGGIGRFTAAIVGGFTKSFTGDHTIYPQIFQSASSTQSVQFTVHLVSDSGDPYSYLTNILVPLFYIMGMALPRLSKNNAAAYAFPPIIQANVPGLWGTRLGMITSLTVIKNPNSTDVSINGYPLSVDVQISIADLQHVLMTSPMDEISTFLNNNTMFDYIAQMCGCDKYRVNPAVRLVTKLALTSTALYHTFDNIGDSVMAGVNTWLNRKFGYSSV